ncbi:hypothetical protein TVAG_016760 [Trichomonas vaginalis G3]|uniref:Uncharacterized protein n=1 Tax=Trichomonas vaginalis (strain ATCC PRA-98 / G3) TaxID=412133 RepID=A2ER14_TRIV3|nr:hypothetical protein TVAGG3_0535240 [Trichomonas vaginalis G3]EAY04904.1 hypothetical protein TVAG_016760 [Trichomonas vaginalis G3]KAI5519438.1 hypothetical protein TVAGG3_0535240 [Trichomonas vaginalis G3]|eukprot:XP_001317127.1 hypothetical protein [Trichomonas vaginalis G3]
MSTINRPVTALIYPRGTCKAQTFYFRGDDIHKEPEFLDNKFRSAKIQYDRAKTELDEEKQQYEKVQAELAKREGYTVTLASALGDESNQTEENAKLRTQITKLQDEIEKFDNAISEAKDQQHPGLLAQLQKERTFYNAEIEDLRISIFTGIDNIRNDKEQIAKIVTSKEYTDASMVKSDRMAFQKFYSQLRTKMDKQFAEFSAKQAESAKQRQIRVKLPPSIDPLCTQRNNAILEKEEVIRNKEFAELRKKLTAQVLLDQLETMNQTIIALGGEPVDIEEIREKYGAQPQQQQEEEAKEQQSTKQRQIRSPTRTSARNWKDIPKPRSRTAYSTTRK